MNRLLQTADHVQNLAMSEHWAAIHPWGGDVEFPVGQGRQYMVNQVGLGGRDLDSSHQIEPAFRREVQKALEFRGRIIHWLRINCDDPKTVLPEHGSR